MKGGEPMQEAYTISSDDSDSDCKSHKKPTTEDLLSAKYDISESEVLLRRAKMYQEYMSQIPIPILQDSVIPCSSWQGLAKSVKKLYGQPLHYLTNTLLKQWDQMRVGSEDECLALDAIIHPSKAEAQIWVVEETHRVSASHHYLAKLWALDPKYHACIDSVASVAPQDVMVIE